MSLKVSVLMPVYNGEKYLEKTLRSVLAQTHSPHEIIAVDDGSTDGTAEILGRFAPRVRYRHIPNGGVANARNIALSMAEGDWVAFIDHDDLWFKNKLERQVAYALKYPEAGLSCANYFLRVAFFGNRLTRHYAGLRFRQAMRFDEPLSDAFRLLLHENFVGTSSAVMIRRDIARQVGDFDPDLVVCEDYHYWLRLTRLTKAIALSEPLFYKRTHGGNLSNDLVRIYDYNRRILKDVAVKEETYIKQNAMTQDLRRSLAYFAYQKGDELFRMGRNKDAYASYRDALGEDVSAANLCKYATVVAKRTLRAALGKAA